MRFLLASLALTVSSSWAAAETCRCLPADDCWPSESEWDGLNSTVSGNLVKVVPIGAVCHDPTYDEAACAEVKASWNNVQTQ